MMKCVKWLGGLAAIVAISATALLGPSGAHADSPPKPPARFVGSVKVDGAAVPGGTVIEARIGSASCGTVSTFNSGGEARYALDVPGLDPQGSPNCGVDDAVVTFYIGGKKAIESGSWKNFDLNVVNLTYVTPTPTPVPTTAVPTTPDATTPGATTPPKPATPIPPRTGTGSESGSTTGYGLVVVLLSLGVVAFATGGIATARRAK